MCQLQAFRDGTRGEDRTGSTLAVPSAEGSEHLDWTNNNNSILQKVLFGEPPFFSPISIRSNQFTKLQLVL